MFPGTRRRGSAKRSAKSRRTGGSPAWHGGHRTARSRRERPSHPASLTASFDGSIHQYAVLMNRSILLACLASALLGVTIAMVIAGLELSFSRIFTEPRFSGRTVSGSIVGAALLALAVGIRVPQRLSLWVCLQVWRRIIRRGQTSDLSEVLLGRADADRPLYWLVLAVISLAAGGTTALLPIFVRWAGLIHAWMQVHFVWSLGPLAVWQAGLAFTMGLIPLAALGLTVSCVHHLSCPYGRWDTRATGWLLIGAAGGVWIAQRLSQATGRGAVILAAAALPVLIVSLISAASKSARRSDRGETFSDHALPLPTWSDRWPRLLRAGIVAVGAGGACTLAVWIEHLAGLEMSAGVIVPILLLTTGAGVWAGCRSELMRLPSIGTFGVMCTLSGLTTGIGCTGLAEATSRSGTAGLTAASISMVVIGCTAACGRRALLNRVASRSTEGAMVVSRMVSYAAVIFWIGVPVAQRLIGKLATLATAAVFLVALGGMLIIHEPAYSRKMRRWRLGLVFGAISLMTAGALLGGR